MDQELKIWTILSLPSLIIILPFLILVLTNTPIDIKVDPEYMNGILAGSSILFGFWAVIIGKPPEIEVKELERSIGIKIDKRQVEKFSAKNERRLVIFNLVFLLIAVWFMFLCAIGLMFSTIALCFGVISFNLNLYTLTIKLIFWSR